MLVDGKVHALTRVFSSFLFMFFLPSILAVDVSRRENGVSSPPLEVLTHAERPHQ